MLNLDGYQQINQIYTGTRTLLYRAIQATQGQPVIIKVLHNPHPTFNELVQFRNQYIITRHLKHPAILQPLALERYDNGYALVMPNDGEISLWDYWQDCYHSLTDFLNIAIQLASALHYLTQQRIIHKDIKPANILIHPETKQIKLIDFSISTLLPTEQQQLINPNVLEGTLAYISPEQTGRMNRGIDYRTDFYSLGVTFFELLSGELPFTTTDPMKLLHCHIAQPAKFPEESEVPKILQEIVLKLMAKNAEDRYQSALGLKYDLERCQQQLETTEKFTSFELGQRDKSDRFIIPEKLYGRKAEVQSILDAFERVANPLNKGGVEMMLVAGFSGIGKTAVIKEVHKPIVRQRGYFIKGKYDQFQRDIPFSAFVQAFGDLMKQLLSESDTELATWKTKILKALGDNAQVIIEVVPELETIIGTQAPAPELSGSAAQNCLNLLFQKFIAVFTAPSHPVVMFLDNLQWADSASLNLMKVLMSSTETGYLLILGAYQDNEVFPAHPLMLTLSELEKNLAVISTITLQPLALQDINQLVADTLNCSQQLAQPLSKLVYQKTQGNPFFTTQFLKGLQVDGLIKFDRLLGYWECDLVKVIDAAITDDVVEFMARRLDKLPVGTQEVLKLAACIGNSFELETLAVVCEKSVESVAEDIWDALQEGLILPISQAYKFFQGGVEEIMTERVTVGYRFLHDRVQQAAYSLIPEEEKQATHWQIGQLLLQQIPVEEREERIFEIVSQLNLCSHHLMENIQVIQICKLNLLAGKKAKFSTAYQAGCLYLSTGIKLLPPDSWNVEYKLTFSLYQEGIECHYLAGYFSKAENLVAEALKNAGSVLEKASINAIRLVHHQNSALYEKAINIGLESLKMLGLELPIKPDKQIIKLTAKEVEKNINDRNIRSLELIPDMDNPEYQMILLLLINMIPPSYISNQSLMVLVILRMTNICLEYGNTPLSSFVYMWYGTVLCSIFKEYDKGDIFGTLGLELNEKFNFFALKGKVLMTFGSFISHWRRPLQEGLDSIKRSFSLAMEAGELSWCFHGGSFNFWKKLLLYDRLETLAEEQNKLVDFAMKIEKPAALALAIQQQVAVNLQGYICEQFSLSDENFNENSALEIFADSQYFYGMSTYYFAKLFIHFNYDDYLTAYQLGLEAEKFHKSIYSQFQNVLHDFYQALNLTHIYHQASTAEKEDYLKRLQLYTQRFKLWSDNCPENYSVFSLLLEAEVNRIQGNNYQALEYYERAIDGAKENKYLQLEALANELAAKFHLDWGKEKFAAIYMQQAYYCYARWGAKAKTDQLEKQYPQLLTPILKSQQLEISPFESWDNFTETFQPTIQEQTNSTKLFKTLDLASILQVTQTISSTIELNQLLSDIVEIILTNAGAQKTVLLIPQTDQWQIRAMAELASDGIVETSTKSLTLTDESLVPIRLIQYVKNTEQSILINKSQTDIPGILEGYLLKYQPQSILCIPLLYQSNLVGILYLEHPTTKGVFTSYRQTIVQFICTQAAISLRNAQLYDQATQALRDLQQAHLQIVQSEKMSALGNLMAGVAHEINNPLGFIAGNIQLAQENLADLLDHLEVYEKNASTENIADHAQEIDLEYLRGDFPNILESIDVGVERMKKISNSLRIFSRQDREKKTAFNIHDGIESTLTILKHRTKASEQHPQIKIITDYEELPEINCFPGQLNQVFMNILANAIDALEETNEGQTYAKIEGKQNCIQIRTSRIDENHVKIEIEDNGSGMNQKTKDRIFEYGFTTKKVGKGTGLGMAIAHQIITEKHGGTITCDSTVAQGTIFTILLPIN
ncbi:MAG: AAA family ATPase [Okeania sp. SIO3C4]|nr:AAA family ATPase [Okeania sp. SIO3C4]